MLLALLLPDPCDEECPPEFKAEARELLGEIPGETKKLAASNDHEDLRKALLKFIGDFANWDLSSNREYLEASRGLVTAALGERPPLVVDPCAGGGSIPCGALRLGCDAFASDLNPVGCLILKTMLEDIPGHGPGLVDDLRRVCRAPMDQSRKQTAMTPKMRRPKTMRKTTTGALGQARRRFSLLFDVVRRFAQPLGIRLPEWEGRIIETKKGVVRLLSVSERARQLFGEEGAEVVADRLEIDSRLPLTGWLPGLEPRPAAPSIKGRGRKSSTRSRVSDEALTTHREATTLDRIHAAMILQSSGRANALRALLKAEQERGPDFVRLANALSALYPKDSEEKRLLDAMLLAVPR